MFIVVIQFVVFIIYKQKKKKKNEINKKNLLIRYKIAGSLIYSQKKQYLRFKQLKSL